MSGLPVEVWPQIGAVMVAVITVIGGGLIGSRAKKSNDIATVESQNSSPSMLIVVQGLVDEVDKVKINQRRAEQAVVQVESDRQRDKQEWSERTHEHEMLVYKLGLDLEAKTVDIQERNVEIDQLKVRVTKMESELTESQRDLNIAMAYIERLYGYMYAQIPGFEPPPIPTELEKHR